MSPEAQRVAIAEACGWDIDPVEAHGWGSRGQWCVRPNDAKRQLVSRHMELPNYLNDLNAMHEAEKVKEMIWNAEYSWWLGRIATRNRGLDPDKQEEATQATIGQFATAAQRAEALLRTIGKWEDDN